MDKVLVVTRSEGKLWVLTRRLMTVEEAEKYRETFPCPENIEFVYPVRDWTLRMEVHCHGSFCND